MKIIKEVNRNGWTYKHKYANEHCYVVIKEYADYAMSGRSDDRPPFNLMLKEIKEMKPAAVIVWKSNRLSRDLVASIMTKREIRDVVCKLEYVAEA